MICFFLNLIRIIFLIIKLFLFKFFIFSLKIEIEFGYYTLLVEKPDYLNTGNSILIQIFELNGIHCFYAHVQAYWDYDLNRFVEVNYLVELTERMK
jgi:hypothetical protein